MYARAEPAVVLDQCRRVRALGGFDEIDCVGEMTERFLRVAELGVDEAESCKVGRVLRLVLVALCVDDALCGRQRGAEIASVDEHIAGATQVGQR